MEFESGLFADIVVVMAAAFAGALAARLLRLPLLLGYLAMGMVIGPHALRIVGDAETVEALAEFGVILLLFAVGVEISFRDLRHLGRVIVLGGIGQILATIGVAYAVGVMLLHWTPAEAAVLGLVVSLSSTMVVLKTLTDRGELHSVHGQLLTGVLLIQDLAFIPMIAVLPALTGEGGLAREVALGLGKAVVVLGLMGLLGVKAIPWLLDRITHLGSREVFILTVVTVTFGTAAITQTFGLSAAVGAFVAGLLLSESDFGHRALSEVVPLRDTFAALFFVSLGMLTDPAYLVDNAWLVLGVVAMVMVLKFVLTAGLVGAFGYLPHTALLAGVGMAQVGEFSFILADSAAALGVVSQDFLTLTVVSAVFTMALTPAVIAGGARGVAALSGRFRVLRPYRLGQKRAEERRPRLRGHAIVCGLGRVGSLVAEELHVHGVALAVIDLEPRAVAAWRGRARVAIHGASTSESVLEAAGIRSARLLVISTGDSVSTWATAHYARAMNPGLDVVARVRRREDGEGLVRIGVQEVVWPEMEAGLEILRHSLRRFATSRREVDLLIADHRDRLSFGDDQDLSDLLPAEGPGGGMSAHHGPRAPGGSEGERGGADGHSREDRGAPADKPKAKPQDRPPE